MQSSPQDPKATVESKGHDFINELEKLGQDFKISDPELKTTLADLPNYNVLTWAERLEDRAKGFKKARAGSEFANIMLNEYLDILDYFKKLIQDVNGNKINTKTLQQIQDAFSKKDKNGYSVVGFFIYTYRLNFGSVQMQPAVILKILSYFLNKKIISREQILEQYLELYLELYKSKTSISIEEPKVFLTDFDDDFEIRKLDEDLPELKVKGIELPNLDVLAWAQAIYYNGDKTAISNFKQLLQDINDNKIDIKKVQEAFEKKSEEGVPAVWYLAKPRDDQFPVVFNLLRNFVNKNIITKNQVFELAKNGRSALDQLLICNAYRNLYYLLQRGFYGDVLEKKVEFAERKEGARFKINNLIEFVRGPECPRLIIALLKLDIRNMAGDISIGAIGNFLIDFFQREKFKINMQKKSINI